MHRLPGLGELGLVGRVGKCHEPGMMAAEPEQPGTKQVYDLKNIFFGMRGRVPAILLGLALSALAASTATAATNLGCGAGKLVLKVRYRVLNDVDTGVRGNNWAFDTYERTVHVWRKTTGRYCAESTFDGVFATIAGASPGGRTTIPAGIRGTFRGQSVTTFRGTQKPTATPTRGDLGVKDFQCTSADVKGQCAGTYDWLSAYFTSKDNFKSFTYVRYQFAYHATEAGKGTWTDMLVGRKYQSHGDITALKKH